jgi:hypothetical protein
MSQPWFKFFPSAWRSSPELRMCGMAARGLWIEMLCIMHESEPRGYLIVGSSGLSVQQLANLAGLSVKECTSLLSELEAANVFSRDNHGIYSRRMVRDTEKSAKDKANGGTGGNPSLKGGVNPPHKATRARESRTENLEVRKKETSSSSKLTPEKNDDDEVSGIESSKKRCEEAAGRCLGRFDVIELLMQEGVELETCVLPVIREVVANQRKRGLPAPVTWCYFDAEIRNRDALNRRDVAAVSSRKFVVYETPEYQNISKRNPSFWKTRLENFDGKTGVWFYGEPSVDCEVRA